MRVGAAFIIAVACAACGRIGFDGLTDDGGGNGSGSGGSGSGAPDGPGSGQSQIVIGASGNGTGMGTVSAFGNFTLAPGDTIIIATNRAVNDTASVTFAGLAVAEDIPIGNYGTGPIYTSLWSYRATATTTGKATSAGPAGSSAQVVAIVVSGLAANALDQSNETASTGTSATVSAAGVTDTADELVVGIASSDMGTCNGAWSAGLVPQGPYGGSGTCMTLAYQVVSATETPAVTFGPFPTRAWGAGVASYRGQ